MHIGVDIQTLQTAEATRGIGRVVHSLVRLLIDQTDHHLTLFGRDPLPNGVEDLVSDRVPYVPITDSDGRSVAECLAQGPVADFLSSLPAAARLDLYHVTSPMMPDILIPRAPAGLPVVATLYDAIPALYRARRTPLMDQAHMARHDERVLALQRYRQFLPISVCTARDCTILQDLPGSRMTVTYTPCPEHPPLPEEQAQALAASVGVSGGHVLCISGYNPRKNLRGTLSAYAHLPVEYRQRHPLVLVCKLQAQERSELGSWARDLGIRSQFIATGYVADDVLQALIQTARLLFFPSEYEGFGLPVAEALLTGIPVVTRNNSSLPEVLGPGGYATGPDDAEAALAMLRILQNQDLGSQLGDAGRAHARSFLPDRFLDRVLLGYESAFQPDGPTGDKVRQDGATAHSDDCNGSAPVISRSQLRHALGVQPHAHLVVVGGGAHPGNRTDVLASVLEILTRRHAGLVLALTGPCDRDEVQRLFAWASARCLRHALVVTGPVSPAVEQQWFQAADVLVPPPPARDGAIQGFLDRARATGTAPILGRQDRDSSNSPSTDWTFAPGPDESVQLAAAIEHLLKNPADAESLIHHQSTANS